MHHRHPCAIAVCLLLIVGGFATSSFGELPQNIVTSADPTPQRATIDTYVDSQVKLLAGADTGRWATGRTSLLSPVAQAGATTAFFDTYADSVNNYLLPLTTNTDSRIRLNAAIVVARIASKAPSGRLARVTLALLKDRSDAVVLWGLQAAKYILPTLLATMDAKTADALGKTAVQATKDHMTPAVIEEAYRTLLLDPGLPVVNPHALNDIKATMLSGYLPNPLALYEYRIKQYDEADAPKEPETDTWATGFLILDKVWSSDTPAQKGQTLSLMLALLKGQAKQNAATPSPEMFDVIKRTGQAFTVVANQIKQPEMTAAAKKMAEVTPATPPDDINVNIANLDAAIKAAGFPLPPSQ